MDRRWDDCHNKEWVREWSPVTMKAKNRQGLSENVVDRKKHSNKIADELMESLCACVAIFTCVDARDHRYWLAKPIEPPQWVEDGKELECPSSGVKFGQGERVLKVHWYDRQDGTDDIFELRPDLGEFYVSTSMLRAGLKSKPVELHEEVAHRTRSGTTCVYRISAACHEHIMDMIENIFRDRSRE